MSLLICTPMYGGMCLEPHFKSCLQLKEDLTTIGFKHDWLTTRNESLITRGRNTSVASFLKTDYERLLFIDADIDFVTEDVEKLWNMNVDVAVGAYKMKSLNAPLSAWKEGKLVEIINGKLDGSSDLTEVDYARTGFMMIKRNVFEEMKAKFPEWEYRDGHVGECWGFFMDPLNDQVPGIEGLKPEDRFHLSEDYFFCRNVREMGGKITLDPTIRLGHWGMFRYG